MSRGACTFRKRDLQVALKAIQEAGQTVADVKIETGSITIRVVGKAEEQPTAEPSDGGKEWRDADPL
jgi:hypothetical protein